MFQKYEAYTTVVKTYAWKWTMDRKQILILNWPKKLTSVCYALLLATRWKVVTKISKNLKVK